MSTLWFPSAEFLQKGYWAVVGYAATQSVWGEGQGLGGYVGGWVGFLQGSPGLKQMGLNLPAHGPLLVP